MAFESPCKPVQVPKLSPTWKPSGSVLPFTTHWWWDRGALWKLRERSVAGMWPVFASVKDQALDHSRNLTQQHEALRMKKANTLGLMQATYLNAGKWWFWCSSKHSQAGFTGGWLNTNNTHQHVFWVLLGPYCIYLSLCFPPHNALK